MDYDLEQITPWFLGGLLLDLEQPLNCKVDIVTVDILKDMRDKIIQNDRETMVLSSIRDALLSKLLSGEIYVNNTREYIAESLGETYAK